jgi:ammonia channel protein AmtB
MKKQARSSRWRFQDTMQSSVPLAGALILFFGFFPFNAGAGYHVASYEGITSTGRAVVVTVLAAGSGAVSLLLYGLWKFKCWDPAFAINGLLGTMHCLSLCFIFDFILMPTCYDN